MKNTLLTLSLFVASVALSQSNEFDVYQLDTKDSINACSVTAFVDNIELDAGYVEKISGSIITLRLAKNTDYLIHVNDEKYFKIYGSNTDDFSTLPKVALVNDPALVYRVQVGTFSKAIPKSYYLNFNSIILEKKAGTKMTRLMTGNFDSLADVTAAKNQIQSNGFKDAFIVAYYDGERIECAQALKIEAHVSQVENFELTMLNSNKKYQDQHSGMN